SVGLIVDIDDQGCVLRVGPTDDGSHEDPTTGEFASGGLEPTPASCARSLDGRQTMNEWRVKNYRTIGLFVFEPIKVRKKISMSDGFGGCIPSEYEDDIDLADVVTDFPDLRIFSVRNGSFQQYDRSAESWSPVTYDEILGG
ncbi:hypothetical protein, partial [Microbulbifer hainanensis]